MSNVPQYIWRYNGIDVFYKPELDGSGSSVATRFVASIRDHFGAERRFGTVFEWCAGPAFIGFALLAEGLCDALCLADINPTAIDCVRRTVEANRLHDRVRSYVSDNLASVPKHERFDLVVGNPPNFYAINPEHPLRRYVGKGWDILGVDAGWRIHADFYNHIASFLNAGAVVLIREVEPYIRELFRPGETTSPWDTRPDNQETLFLDMASRGGLVHICDIEWPLEWPAIRSSLQVFRKGS